MAALPLRAWAYHAEVGVTLRGRCMPNVAVILTCTACTAVILTCTACTAVILTCTVPRERSATGAWPRHSPRAPLSSQQCAPLSLPPLHPGHGVSRRQSLCAHCKRSGTNNRTSYLGGRQCMTDVGSTYFVLRLVNHGSCCCQAAAFKLLPSRCCWLQPHLCGRPRPHRYRWGRVALQPTHSLFMTSPVSGRTTLDLTRWGCACVWV
jgi:hypothetical protein